MLLYSSLYNSKKDTFECVYVFVCVSCAIRVLKCEVLQVRSKYLLLYVGWRMVMQCRQLCVSLNDFIVMYNHFRPQILFVHSACEISETLQARMWVDKYSLKLFVHDESNVICYSKDSQIYYAAGRHSSGDVSLPLRKRTLWIRKTYMDQFRNRFKWMNTFSVPVS